MENIAETAWNAVKDKDDPVFALCTVDHKNELLQRADGVIRTGVTVTSGGVFQAFEEKVKELHDAESKPKAKADAKPKAEPKADDSGEPETEEVQDLSKLTRAELDEIATKEFGFNPSDYSNKAEIIEAIEKERK